MMGHRGCRLAVTYPSIAKMQTKAVIRAAIEVQKEHADWTVKPCLLYTSDNDIPYSWGTAVNVMPMVFGNLNDQSGTEMCIRDRENQR